MRSGPMVSFLLAVALLYGAAAPPAQDHLAAAVDAARWIAATRVDRPTGAVWPMEPARSETVSFDLYSGTGGVVLFYLDLYRTTDDRRWLDAGMDGARAMAASLADPAAKPGPGLYTGLAGRCFVLHRAAEIGGDADLYRATRECLGDLIARGRPAGDGLEWNEVTDVIGGSAGIGLTLLWAHETLAYPGALEAAEAAGERLLERAIPAANGLKWAMADEFPRLMPNFSHGTAGIAYFLARLHEVTGQERFLHGALAGARYLQEAALTDGEVCLIFHHEPEGEELYYLSWCHGPAGTGRTFYQLYRATGDAQWLEWTRRAARGIAASGIPEVRTPGFWNNVSRCCGNAGVAEFYLDLYGQLGDPEYLEAARRMAADLLDRATRDAAGLRWIQAEHRVQPENLAAQTGYMQGAAGIGSMFLRLHAAETGAPAPVVLPDSPFGS